MKNNNIYDQLNDIETEYEDVKLDKEQIDQIKKDLLIDEVVEKEKPSLIKRFLPIAAAAALVAGVIFTDDGRVLAELTSYVESFFTDTRVELAETNELPEDVEKYTVNLHETVTLKHMSFVIEDIVIDGTYGYLNLIYPEEYSSKFNDDFEYNYIVDRVYVNDEHYYLHTSSSFQESIGDGLISDYIEFQLRDPVPDNGEVKLGIQFSEFGDPDDQAIVELNISTEELAKDSNVYLEDFNVPGSRSTKINNMIINPINPRLYITYKYPKDGFVRRLYFVGENDQGEQIVFKSESSRAIKRNYQKATLRFVDKNDDSNDDNKLVSDFTVKELYQLQGEFNFQIYIDTYQEDIFGNSIRDEDGVLITEREEIGDSFVVDLEP